MTRFFAPLLVLAAAVAAIVLLVRARRGRPVVLTGRWSPRLARRVAVLLLLFGFLTGRARAGEDPFGGGEPSPPEEDADEAVAGEELPAAVTDEAVERWLESRLPDGGFRTAVERFASAWAAGDGLSEEARKLLDSSLNYGVPPRFGELLRTELEARQAGRAAQVVAPADLIAVLAEVEGRGLFDAFVAGTIWRRTPAAADLPAEGQAALAELLARLRTHARIRDALVKAKSEVKPSAEDARPWMSKAARPNEIEMRRRTVRLLMMQAMKRTWATTGPGTFARDAVAVLQAVDDGPTPVLVRGGDRRALAAGEAVRFGRLDLLAAPAGDAPVRLRHLRYGEVVLPAGGTFGARDLPERLSAAGRAAVAADVEAALLGDEPAAERLERALPLAAPFVRAAIAERPDRPGSPRLRMILALFDDLPTPP